MKRKVAKAAVKPTFELRRGSQATGAVFSLKRPWGLGATVGRPPSRLKHATRPCVSS